MFFEEETWYRIVFLSEKIGGVSEVITVLPPKLPITYDRLKQTAREKLIEIYESDTIEILEVEEL